MNDAEEVKVLEYFRGTTSGSCASSFGVCCVFEVRPKWYSLLVIVLSRMIGNDHYCAGQQFFFRAGNLWICLPRREQHLLHIKVIRDCHLPQKSWIHILIRNWFWSSLFSGISLGSSCRLEICKCSTDVCQLRLDFETFALNLVGRWPALRMWWWWYFVVMVIIAMIMLKNDF